jgi:hypothetical protein
MAWCAGLLAWPIALEVSALPAWHPPLTALRREPVR